MAKQRKKVVSKKPASKEPLPLFVISDSTGNLANHNLTAVLTQFPQGTFSPRPVNFVSHLTIDPHLPLIQKTFQETGGAVVHAVVDPKLKQKIEAACAQEKIPCFDLTGPFADFLARASNITPASNVLALHEVTEAYHQRIAALEFTLEHDDGLGLETIHLADVVLAGVSRTSKSPTSIYLGQQGFRTANVALAIEVEPPAELLALPSTKVVGLYIDPQRLANIRGTRQRDWSMNGTNYSDMDHIKQEVLWSRRLFTKHGWRTLDVTNSAIEETAHRIMTLLRGS
jgi:[pyruvate, water dikinase]-phosphate phosphotransferase / [pyruvate, water dikinase] kinase